MVLSSDRSLRAVRSSNRCPSVCSAAVLLRDSEKRYRMLTETMQDVVWVVDTQTLRFTYVSPRFEELTGVAADHATCIRIAKPRSFALM